MLIKILEKRADAFDRIYVTSLRQGELAHGNDMPGLLEVLAAKQRMLDDLERIERELDPYRDTPPEKRRWATDEERRYADRLIRRCEIRLRAIIDQDRESERILAEKRSDIQKELRNLGNRHVSNEYVRQTVAERDPEEQRPRLDIQSGK